MIAGIRGTLLAKKPGSVIIEAGGLAYEVLVSIPTYTMLPAEGAEVRLVTWLAVREDAMVLFGFSSMEEKELFLMLTSVSKVGPKMALSILSGFDAKRFRKAVAAQDAALLSSIPGIGKKTAERIIVELKDKFGDVFEAGPGDVRGDVVSALVNLGYKQGDVTGIVSSLYADDVTFDELLKQCLGKLSGG